MQSTYYWQEEESLKARTSCRLKLNKPGWGVWKYRHRPTPRREWYVPVDETSPGGGGQAFRIGIDYATPGPRWREAMCWTPEWPHTWAKLLPTSGGFQHQPLCLVKSNTSSRSHLQGALPSCPDQANRPRWNASQHAPFLPLSFILRRLFGGSISPNWKWDFDRGDCRSQHSTGPIPRSSM